MSNQNIKINGVAEFLNTSENAGLVTEAIFDDSSTNTGIVAVSATFSGTSQNTGIIKGDALFYGSSVNAGEVNGNAYFGDTSSNALGAVVRGDAFVAETATNYGTVQGTVSGNQNGPLWYFDSSSAAHTITLQGNVTQSNEGGGVKAASFDGSSGYLSTAENFTLGETFTVEMFVYQNSGTGVGNGDFVAQSVGGLQFYHNNSDNTFWYSQGGVVNLLSTNVNFTDGWHHIAAVRDGSSVAVYLDGVAVITGTDSTDFGASPLLVGAAPWANQYLYGKIAGLRITNTAVYTSNFTVPTTLPTAIIGTQLLLNFGATAAPTPPPANYRPLNNDGYADWAGAWQNCSGSGSPHGNLYTNATTLDYGVGVFSHTDYGYVQDNSSWQLIVGGIQYSYSGGVISNIAPC